MFEKLELSVILLSSGQLPNLLLALLRNSVLCLSGWSGIQGPGSHNRSKSFILYTSPRRSVVYDVGRF